jgi:rod shape determining protein RodA
MKNNRITVHEGSSLIARLRFMPWGLLVLLCILGSISFLCLYSAGGGSLEPWALKHGVRFAISLAGLVVLALIDVRIWYRLVWPIYIVSVILLIVVDIAGHTGMGAQRWINLGFIKLQPSEVMKIATVMMLAYYFHSARPEQLRNPFFLLTPLGLVALPVGLVMLQPDLGTAMMILFVTAAMFFVAGVAIWMFVAAGLCGLAMLPIAWSLMHDYQRNRVLTFLNPESDPLGTGYHITQSKIALGSGGIFGKGFLQGTQSHLDFLPEKHTDFIFTLWAEEWGLLGSVFLLGVYALIVMYGFWMAERVHHRFGRLLVLGLTINFGLYAMINTAMVMGLIPVVGVPLVLISYGGTAMLSVLAGFGIAASAVVYRDTKMPRGIG